MVLDSEGLSIGEVPLALERQDQAALGRVRDLAVVAVIEGGHAQVEIVDPFAMRLVGRPREVGPAWRSTTSASGSLSDAARDSGRARRDLVAL